MAYEPANYDSRFNASIQGQGFNAVRAIDASSKIKEQTKQQVENVRQLGRDSAARHQVEMRADKLNSAYNQAVSDAEMRKAKVEQGFKDADAAAFKGLLSLTQTGLSTYQKMQKQKEIDDKRKAEEQAAMGLISNAAGGAVVVDQSTGETLDDNPAQTQQTIDTLASNDQAVSDMATANENAVIDIAGGDEMKAEELRAPMADETAARRIGQQDVHTASIRIRGDLEDFMSSQDMKVRLADGRVISPSEAKTRGELTEVLMAGVQYFSQEYGMTSGDAAAVAKTYIPAVKNAISGIQATRGPQITAAQQNGRIESYRETAATQLAAGGETGDVWSQMSSDYYASGKYAGDRTRANDAAMKDLLEILVANGDVDAIRDLAKSPKFIQANGKPGPLLETTYGPEIQKAIKDARRSNQSDYTMDQNDAKIELAGAKATFDEAILTASTPEEITAAHEAYEASLAGMNTPEANAALITQRGISNNYNPTAYGEMLDQITTGDPVTASQVQEMMETGIIQPTQAQDLIRRIGKTDAEQMAAALKPYKDEVSGLIDAGISSVITQSDNPLKGVLQNAQGSVKDVIKTQMSSIKADMTERLQRHMAGYLTDHPDANPAQIREEIASWTDKNVKNLLQNASYEDGRVTGYNFYNPERAAIANSTFKDTSTGNPTYVLTGSNSIAVVNRITELNQNQDPADDVDATRDRLVTKQEMVASMEAIEQGNLKAIPNRVKKMAHALGMTPQKLIQLQGKSQGIDLDARISAGQSTASNAGYFEAAGFTEKGAPILAQSIPPGQTVSMLEQTVEELKTSNPDAYRILRNPAARTSQVNRVEQQLNGGNDPAVNPNLTNQEKAALRVLGKYESDSVGGYNAVNQIGTDGGHGVKGYSGHYNKLGGQNLTNMTVGEIMELQARRPGMSDQEWINQGRLHAVGRYQFIGPTFAAVVQQMGIDPNQKLTPALQDAMALHLLRTSSNGIGQWVGPSTYATAAERRAVRAAQRA